LICDPEVTVATKLVGVEGGVVSAETITESTGVTVWLRAPLDAVTVKLKLPTVVAPVVETVIVVEPEVVTVAGLNEALAPEGKPAAEKPTEPVNPGAGTTPMV
jgi:hypothetical protein